MVKQEGINTAVDKNENVQAVTSLLIHDFMKTISVIASVAQSFISKF